MGIWRFLRCPMFAFILSDQKSPRMTQKTAQLDKMARTICLCEHVRSAERIPVSGLNEYRFYQSRLIFSQRFSWYSPTLILVYGIFFRMKPNTHAASDKFLETSIILSSSDCTTLFRNRSWILVSYRQNLFNPIFQSPWSLRQTQIWFKK